MLVSILVTELTHTATLGHEMAAYTGVVEILPATPRHRPSYRTRVRSLNPGPRSDAGAPRTRQHCQHDRDTRTDQARPPPRVRAVPPTHRTDQDTDQHGCGSVPRARSWALCHRHGRMHDRFSRRGALHTDPGTDAAQITGGRPPGNRSNTAALASKLTFRHRFRFHGWDMELGRALLAISNRGVE